MFSALQIFGGPDDASPLLIELCHTQKDPVIVTTSGNHAFVRFISDETFSGKGFRASFETVSTRKILREYSI